MAVRFVAVASATRPYHHGNLRSALLARAVEVIADAQAAGELVPGDGERVAIPIFAALQGLTAMVNGGMLDAAHLDDAVTVAIGQLLDGLRPR